MGSSCGTDDNGSATAKELIERLPPICLILLLLLPVLLDDDIGVDDALVVLVALLVLDDDGKCLFIPAVLVCIHTFKESRG